MTDHADSPPVKPFALTRDALLSDGLRRFQETVPGYEFWSDERLDESLDRTLAARPAEADGDVWLFGYGSLIWNPTVHSVEMRTARIEGWYRAFCLSTKAGRGSPENPGLVLALDAGGACTGVAFRLAEDILEVELALLWRREMLSGAYVPRWVEVLD